MRSELHSITLGNPRFSADSAVPFAYSRTYKPIGPLSGKAWVCEGLLRNPALDMKFRSKLALRSSHATEA
jgi:hypothetical protein